MLWSPYPPVYQASLRGRSLCAAGRASVLRLELPQGKPCLFSDRLSPYEISFLINPHGSNAPEMQGRINWLSAAAFHLPHTTGSLLLSHNFYSSALFINTLFRQSKLLGTKKLTIKCDKPLAGLCSICAFFSRVDKNETLISISFTFVTLCFSFLFCFVRN